ncbi:MAG: ATP-binding protein [Pseudomonadales bacterium]
MDTAQLRSRLADAEDNFVERKLQNVRSDEIRQTASAFANQLTTDEQAILFIGVTDDGKPVGVDNTDELQKRVRRACQDQCYPPIQYTAKVLAIDGKPLLAVVIPASDNKPHFTGPAYVRVGSESVKASTDQFTQMIASQNTKCGRLQRLGNQVLSVVAHKKLGDSNQRYINDQQYREHHECKVDSVDAHSIQFYDIGLSQRFSEPLDNIDIAIDEDKNRPLLIVRQR